MANSIKYEITDETKLFNDTVLHRIRAVKEIPGVVLAGEDGGWIEYPHNLSQKGSCWIAPNAIVMGAAQVIEDAFINDNAIIQNNAIVLGTGIVWGNAIVKDFSGVQGLVHDNAVISGSSLINEVAEIQDNAQIINSAINQFAVVGGNAKVSSSSIYSHTKINDNTIIEDSTIYGDLEISGNSVIKGSIIKGNYNIIENAAISKSTDILNITYAAEDGFIELTIYRNTDDNIIVTKINIDGTSTSTKLEDADLGDLTTFVYNYFQAELPNFSSDSTTSGDTSDSSTTDTENTESTSDEP